MHHKHALRAVTYSKYMFAIFIALRLFLSPSFSSVSSHIQWPVFWRYNKPSSEQHRAVKCLNGVGWLKNGFYHWQTFADVFVWKLKFFWKTGSLILKSCTMTNGKCSQTRVFFTGKRALTLTSPEILLKTPLSDRECQQRIVGWLKLHRKRTWTPQETFYGGSNWQQTQRVKTRERLRCVL